MTCDQKQGAWGENGVHFFVTNDTDNAFSPKPVTEVDSQQWQFVVPTGQPTNAGDAYANDVRAPLQVGATPQSSTPAQPTQLSYTGQASGPVGDPATLAAQLTDSGNPVPGQKVEFAFEGQHYEGTTDQSGTASVQVTPQAPAGQDQVDMAFAGQGAYLPSSAQATFAATTRAGRITLSVPARKAYKGPNGKMTATLVDLETGAPIAGKTIRFTVNGADWSSQQTDANGVATATASGTWTTGTTIAAAFAGDDIYDPVRVQVRYNRTKGMTGSATSGGGR